MRAAYRVTSAGPDGGVCGDADCGGCCDGVRGAEGVRMGGVDGGGGYGEARERQFAVLNSQDKGWAGG